MMKILVTMPRGEVRNTFIPEAVAGQIETLGTVVWNETDSQYTKEALREKLSDVDICIAGWGSARLDEYVLEKASKLKLLVYTGGTVAPVVSESLYAKGIKVISGNRFFAESVAEGVIAYMLAALRDIPLYNREVHEGIWRWDGFYTEGLLDQTVGIVGFGMIAECLVKMLQPFRAKIKVYSAHISDAVLKHYGMQKAELEEIFESCKIISLHTSLRPETHHMIDQRLLSRIQDGALLINTARGAVIDEAALIQELEKGRFKAALDVFEQEPLPKESKLTGFSNVILMPHMAGPTIDRRRHVTAGLLEDVGRWLDGKALVHEINREYAGVMTR